MSEFFFVAVISALLSGTVMTCILAPRTLKMGFEWARAEVKLARVEDKLVEVRGSLSDEELVGLAERDSALVVDHIHRHSAFDHESVERSLAFSKQAARAILDAEKRSPETDKELCQRYDAIALSMEDRGLAVG